MSVIAPQAIPTLETERLTLRGPVMADFEPFAAMWADDAVIRHILPEPRPREVCWGKLLEMCGHWQLMGFGYWIVEARADGRFIGQVGFGDFKRPINPPLGSRPEAGWVLRAAEHGRGFGKEAVTCAIGWADRHLDAEETVCIFDPAHAASIRLAEKVGYRLQGMADFAGQETQVMVRRRVLGFS